MEGSKAWRKRLLASITVAGISITSASELRADMLHLQITDIVSGAGAEMIARAEFSPAVPAPGPIAQVSLLEKVRGRWNALREEMARAVLDATLPAIFIRPTPPPAPPAGQSTPPTPPSQQGGGGGDTTPPPPPPSGGGETPGGNPPVDPPPTQGAPEPASLVSALLGAGISWIAWRRRRREEV